MKLIVLTILALCLSSCSNLPIVNGLSFDGPWTGNRYDLGFDGEHVDISVDLAK